MLVPLSVGNERTRMPDLNTTWRQLRVDLAMLATGSVTSWNKSGATGKPGHRVLADTTTNTKSIVDVFQARWDGCRDDLQRESVIEAAREHIRLEQGRGRLHVVPVDTDVSREQIDRDILKLGVGMSPREVSARKEFLHPSLPHVRALRRDAGLDPETGAEDQRTRKVRDLAAQGFRQTEIARQVKLSQQSVSRILKRAA